MATSTGSTTDCFMIELKITTLDDTAEPNDDTPSQFQATGARIRYLTRRGIAAPEAAVSSSSIAGCVALPVFPQDPMEFIHTPPWLTSLLFTPILVPAQREISNATMNSLRPQYQRSPLDHVQFRFTIVIPGLTKIHRLSGRWEIGEYPIREKKSIQIASSQVFGNPMTPQDNRRYFNVEFDLAASSRLVTSITRRDEAARQSSKTKTPRWRSLAIIEPVESRPLSSPTAHSSSPGAPPSRGRHVEVYAAASTTVIYVAAKLLDPRCRLDGARGNLATDPWDSASHILGEAGMQWVYGTDCKRQDFRPTGWPGSPAMFWFPHSRKSNQKMSECMYTATYADGSFAEYELWTDFVYLHPYWGPPPVQEPDKAWLHLTFGVASRVSSLYQLAPTSGILGLGRRRRSSSKFDLSWRARSSPFFLTATKGFVFDVLAASVAMTTDSHITFSRRPDFSNLASNIFALRTTTSRSSGTITGLWPVQPRNWMETHTRTRTELQNWTPVEAALCYLDDKFVKDFYACIPGSTTKKVGNLTLEHQFYHVIPAEVNATPRVELDIGGHLPKGLLIGNSGGAAFDGPDMIGRVALINMEVVMQMPDRGPDNISWRRKETSFTGPGKQEWESDLALQVDASSICVPNFHVPTNDSNTQNFTATVASQGNPVGRVVHRGLAWLRQLRHCGMQGRMGVEGEEGDRRNAE
ncbi:hypothetical protein B0H14DRAFT_3634613 [Mycena olivaceomarginata]|nr:hypothetical protein B0H14DRAFT_3634613 [Mycena olivaceomarginata]